MYLNSSNSFVALQVYAQLSVEIEPSLKFQELLVSFLFFKISENREGDNSRKIGINYNLLLVRMPDRIEEERSLVTDMLSWVVSLQSQNMECNI